MRAAVRDRYGPPEVVRVVAVDRAAVRDRDMLVRVRATTVNRTDCGLRAARPWSYRLFLGSGDRGGRSSAPSPPVRSRRSATGSPPSRSASGCSGSVRPPLGPRRVLGRARGRVDGGHPEGLTFEEAAPSSEGSHYARSSIRAAKVRRGQDVLVYGATSAIGSAAVQLLKQVGATSRLPARRATRVPYRRVNHGTERTTTVTATPALSWRLALLLLQRIPGICLG
jgi:NADPH:quinone reductase-like Zn-dependent oxidoreductase